MCNLSGYSGKNKPNIHIIKLLAIYGRERGKDGFGTWMGGKLFKNGGYNNEGDSYHVVHGTVVERANNTSNTVLMHNRAKSVGYVNKSNAHPYEFDYIEDKHYIFAHNGTIRNIDALCEKYKIPTTIGSTDSYYLGKIIYEHGFDVLKEYEGFAAITVLDVNTDILYLFRGFSQCESNVASEERPLHVYRRKNALYYSSEGVTLSTAINTHDNIEPMPPNVLFSVLEGNIIEATPYNRDHIVFKKVEYDWPINNHYTKSYNGSGKSMTTTVSSNPKIVTPLDSLYKIEKNPQNESKNRIYCWQGKYWRKGHLLRGPNMISDDGVSYLLTAKEVENYKTSGSNLYDKVRFFVDGYMIKNEDIYNEVIVSGIKPETSEAYNWAQKLYPGTICLKMLGIRYSMYYNGVYVNNKPIVPLYSRFEYLNDNGVIRVKDLEDLDQIKLLNGPAVTAENPMDNAYGDFPENFM